jgi:hypothetical protein
VRIRVYWKETMRWATAAALLVALAISPAFSLLCEARCAEPAAHHEHDSTHAHHGGGSQSSVIGHRSSVLETGPEQPCLSHADTEIGTPERVAFAAVEPAPTSSTLLEAPALLTSAGTLAELRPPPPESRAATPLRI